MALSNDPVVFLTPLSSVRGKVVYARGVSRPVFAYLGIPFATPPIGDLRFKPTKSLRIWNGEKDARHFAPVCPQDMDAPRRFMYPYPCTEEMSEDCLYLNIYTPTQRSTDRLPVMLWIHGGSFVNGFGHFYDGTALAAYHDVIHISINYRLGPFGFMSTGDVECPGNMGIWDQIEALRWVQKYITAFGGDPNNVTVYGESAGGISASFLMLTPVCRGLFHRAIMESGVALIPASFYQPKNAYKFMLKRTKDMGCTSTSTRDMMDFIRKQPAEVLIKFFPEGLMPTADGILFTDTAENMIQSPVLNRDIDVMLGINEHEGAMYVLNYMAIFEARMNPGTKAPRPSPRHLRVPSKDLAMQMVAFSLKMLFYRGWPNIDAIVDAACRVYLGNIPDEEEPVTKALVEFMSHVMFIMPTVRAASHYGGKQRTFFYHMTHRPSYSSYPSWVGADHGQEISYVQGEPLKERQFFQWTEEEKTFSKTMMSYWTNFAKTGDPNGPGLVQWPRYMPGEDKFLELKIKPETKCKYQPEKYNFWFHVLPDISKGKSGVNAKY